MGANGKETPTGGARARRSKFGARFGFGKSPSGRKLKQGVVKKTLTSRTKAVTINDVMYERLIDLKPGEAEPRTIPEIYVELEKRGYVRIVGVTKAFTDEEFKVSKVRSVIFNVESMDDRRDLAIVTLRDAARSLDRVKRARGEATEEATYDPKNDLKLVQPYIDNPLAAV